MQPPQLTPDQIQERCTERSYMRGLEYFHDGAIENPALHGYTLSAICEGTDMDPYRVTIELMPTGIASTDGFPRTTQLTFLLASKTFETTDLTSSSSTNGDKMNDFNATIGSP